MTESSVGATAEWVPNEGNVIRAGVTDPVTADGGAASVTGKLHVKMCRC